MSVEGQQGRKPRADVQRNRAALLEAAQRHFLRDGVGASLEGVAKEAGVGPARSTGTSRPGRRCWRPCCRRAPRNRWPAGRASPGSVTPPRGCGSGCGHWRSTSAPSAGCRNRSWPRPRKQEPGNPLTLPCDDLIATTEEYVRAAQRAGHVRPSVKGYDLYLAAVWLAWTKGTGAHDEEALDRLRALFEVGYREQDEPE